MPTRVQTRRGTTAQHSSFTGAVGELTVDTDKKTVVVHDGSTAGGFPLASAASPIFLGRVLVGTSTARTVNTNSAITQIETTTQSLRSLLITHNQASDVGPVISIGKTRGSTTGSTAVLTANDTLGTIEFTGADGTSLVPGASISSVLDGSASTNSMPSRLVLSVTPFGGTQPQECLRLSPFTGTTVTGEFTINGASNLKKITETSLNNFNTSLAPFSGTFTVDLAASSVVLGDLNAAVTTWAFTNGAYVNSKVITVTLIIDGDTTHTYGDACTVNGTAISGGVKWSGGSAPAATNNFDIITFTIVRDGVGSVMVFGSGNTNFS